MRSRLILKDLRPNLHLTRSIIGILMTNADAFGERLLSHIKASHFADAATHRQPVDRDVFAVAKPLRSASPSPRMNTFGEPKAELVLLASILEHPEAHHQAVVSEAWPRVDRWRPKLRPNGKASDYQFPDAAIERTESLRISSVGITTCWEGWSGS